MRIKYEIEPDGIYCPLKEGYNDTVCAFYYEGGEPYITSDNCSYFDERLYNDMNIIRVTKNNNLYHPLKRCEGCLKKFGK